MAMPPGSKRAFEEALTAIRPYLPPQQAHNPFTLVGGYALNLHGRTRYTFDLDFAISGQSLQHWESAVNAQPHSGFRQSSDGSWSYCCTSEGIEDVTVEIEFLDLSLFASRLHGLVGTSVNGHHIATIQELAILKAEAIIGRDEQRDYDDLLWILQTMETRGERFETMLLVAEETFREIRDTINAHSVNDYQDVEMLRVLGVLGV